MVPASYDLISPVAPKAHSVKLSAGSILTSFSVKVKSSRRLLAIKNGFVVLSFVNVPTLVRCGHVGSAAYAFGAVTIKKLMAMSRQRSSDTVLCHFVAFMALSFLLKMVSVACLMIRYVTVLCHLIPELLRNAALKDNGDGIVSALRTQRYGIGQRVG